MDLQRPLEYADIKVIGVYSNDIEAAKKIKDKYDIDVLSNYDDAVGKVDGVIITARNGKYHYTYAKPYINDLVPMFIDKPITLDNEEAILFMNDLKNHNIRITGGSSLKNDKNVLELKKLHESNDGGKTISGKASAPLYLDSIYGGFYFYAQHLVEMVCTIYGYFPNSVKASFNNGNIDVQFNYGDFTVLGNYVDHVSHYSIQRNTLNNELIYENLEKDSSGWIKDEFEEFYKILNETENNSDYDKFIAPVFIMNAIIKSLAQNDEIKIEYSNINK